MVVSLGPLQHRMLLFLPTVNRHVVWYPKALTDKPWHINGTDLSFYCPQLSACVSARDVVLTAAGGRVWTGAAEGAHMVVRVMGQLWFRPWQQIGQIMEDRALILCSQAWKTESSDLNLTWVWRRDAAVLHTIRMLNKVRRGPEPKCVRSLHFSILRLNWLWFLLHICPQQLSESLNARITAVINISFQALAMVLSVGSLWNILSGIKSMQREHFASWRFQLDLTVQCWLTVENWVYASVLLCSRAVRTAAREVQLSTLPHMDVKPGCYYPWWLFFHGNQPGASLEHRLLSSAGR